MSVDPGARHAGIGRSFYLWAAVGAALIVFAGFARTYFLKGAFGTPALSPLLHTHGLVMTLWFALFIVQTWLVASHRIHIHRRLGIFGAFWAVVVLVVGTTAAIAAARLGRPPAPLPPPLVFLVIPLGDMVVFGTLVGIGLYFRNKREIHRRLMLLCTLSMLPAAFARIPLAFIKNGGLLMFFGLADLCVLAFVAYDTFKSRRLHPAFGWGALFIIASLPLRLMLSGTHAWMQCAAWLVR